MSEKEVIRNIRDKNILGALSLLLPTVFFDGLLIFIGIGLLEDMDSFKIWYLLILGAFGYFAYMCTKGFINYVSLIINPLKDDIFKKYGSPEDIADILKEIEETTIYSDDNLVVSDNYISDKNDYSKIVKCDDVLGVHKLRHKTNFVTDYFQIVITDMYGQEITYNYKSDEENKVDELLLLIGKKCENAELGYTPEERKHIEENVVDLPDNNSTSSPDEVFKCDNCGALVKESDKKCPNCGETFDDEDNSIDKKYTDLKKLKELLDDKIISKEEFEKEKKKILK